MAVEVFVGLFVLIAIYVLWPRTGKTAKFEERVEHSRSFSVPEESEYMSLDRFDPASPFYERPSERR